MRVVGALLAVAAVLAVGGLRAEADSLINNTGLTSPDGVITFSEVVLPQESPVTAEYAGLGVTFSPAMFYNTQPDFFPTQSVANYSVAGTYNPVSLLFGSDLSAVAFAVQTNPGTTTFRALLGGSLVEEFTAPTTLSSLPDTTHASDFFGFTNIVFDEVEVFSNTLYFQMDNLQFQRAAPVPEPGSAAFLLGVLGAVGALRRRLRRS